MAPARLADGNVTDVWRGEDGTSVAPISWSVPENSSNPLRHARFRTFPFLSDVASSSPRFWDSVCSQWDRQQLPSRRVMHFRFYLMRASLEPAGRYGQVQKRLIREHDCQRDR
jgi:hypothetical protein